ncbi:hypothetical protein M514_28301 [Trichuris suis]|uniref:Uncharacterized protein n=1 Tax=Trichuris suis TaxID=68888 RepID=A0A085MQM5_9BILA|nr:hypothetical protein M514_28301 [Trichuris suis]
MQRFRNFSSLLHILLDGTVEILHIRTVWKRRDATDAQRALACGRLATYRRLPCTLHSTAGRRPNLFWKAAPLAGSTSLRSESSSPAWCAYRAGRRGVAGAASYADRPAAAGRETLVVPVQLLRTVVEAPGPAGALVRDVNPEPKGTCSACGDCCETPCCGDGRTWLPGTPGWKKPCGGPRPAGPDGKNNLLPLLPSRTDRRTDERAKGNRCNVVNANRWSFD